MKQVLSENIRKYVNFDEQEINHFFEAMNFKNISKKEFLLKDGQVCKERVFILKGVFKTYYYNEKGQEKINNFSTEGWWLTEIESFVNQSASHFFIQAVEDCKVLSLGYTEYHHLLNTNHKFERLFRLLTEKQLIALQRKYSYYLQLSSKERYEAFVNTLADFSQRIPQYMIASYLEISPEYLSEIRKA